MAASSKGIVFNFESTIIGPHNIQGKTWTPTTGETLEVCVSQVTTFSSIDSTTLFRLACLGFDSHG